MLLIIIIIHLLLASGFTYARPLFEGKDEQSHFAYAVWLVQNKRLPDLKTEVPSHEATQPPLYYVWAGSIANLFDLSDYESITRSNPYATEWNSGNLSYYHSRDEWAIPYQKTNLAIRVTRLSTTIFSILTIVAVYWTLSITHSDLAGPAAAFLAFIPGFVEQATAISNDVGVAAFSSWIILGQIQLERNHNQMRSRGWAVIVGLAWSAATLTKISALMIGAVILLPVGINIIQKNFKGMMQSLQNSLVSIAMFLLTTSWLFIYNLRQYGDLLAWEYIEGIHQVSKRNVPISLWDTIIYSQNMLRNFWGDTGYSIMYPQFWYIIGQAIMLVAFISLIINFIFVYQKNRGSLQLRVYLYSATVIAISYVSWIRWSWGAQMQWTDHFRLLYASYSSVCILLMIGFTSSFRIRLIRWVLVLFPLSWSLVALVVYLPNTYYPPTPIAETRAITNQTYYSFEDQLALVGYEVVSSPIFAGQDLVVDLYWLGVSNMEESYVVSLRAIDSSSQVVAGYDTVPYDFKYPTSVWSPNEVFKDRYTIPIEDKAASGMTQLVLIVYPFGKPSNALQVNGNSYLWVQDFKIEDH